MDVGRLEIPESQRDPVVEFAERYVAALLGGKLASSRIQQGWDVERPNGRKVQVRTLSNRFINEWTNEHTVTFTGDCDEYAIVIFDGRHLHGVVIFQRDRNFEVYEALGKRHAEAETRLNLTRRNMERIFNASDLFAEMGVEIYPARRGNRFRRIGVK